MIQRIGGVQEVCGRNSALLSLQLGELLQLVSRVHGDLKPFIIDSGVNARGLGACMILSRWERSNSHNRPASICHGRDREN